MPAISSYMNYRVFLRDFYLERKSSSQKFTYATFAQKAGLRSPNYYKLVMDGEKNLTMQNISKFSKALELTDKESDYFESLVMFNQAKNALEKEFFKKRLNTLKDRLENSDEKTLEEYEFEVMSHWLTHSLMVHTHVPGFMENENWLSERYFNLIPKQQITSTIEKLIKIGLLTRNSDGKLIANHKQLRTKPELRSLAAKLFYESLFARMSQSLNLTEADRRELGAVFVGIGKKDVPELKRKVRDFLKDLNEWALEKQDPTHVYLLSFCGIPITSDDPRRSNLYE